MGRQAPSTIAVVTLPSLEGFGWQLLSVELVVARCRIVASPLLLWARTRLLLLVKWCIGYAKRIGIVKHWMQSWFRPSLSPFVLLIGKQVPSSSTNMLPRVSVLLMTSSISYRVEGWLLTNMKRCCIGESFLL